MTIDDLKEMDPHNTLGFPGSTIVDHVYFVDGVYWKIDNIDTQDGWDFSFASVPYQVSPVNTITVNYKRV